ncbi:transcriptional regulator family: Fungal Specific TF [Penicillium verhagenii]|uniref:transcriptional regulator family: Fungal Specific TF n=1 Tax=Penicillium verhagenii TaxID=1562060 RepID=UPI0025456C3F|nr:transcriptional regulator family: Fungal Specific TF [Penicillium verhagenii]KAJ5923922.1 transcriptional regulator family: Fungal Specific TF [Penicillium verhagenii]
MVYGGKPSTGCHLCRKRKIKCDEGHPECRNCAIYGRPCPGYRPDPVFRHENRKVERQAKKDTLHSNNSSQGGQSLSKSPENLDSLRGDASSTKTSLTLIPIADATWEQRAICYFFDQYTMQPQFEDGMGHLDFLPSLYSQVNQETSTSSCLRWAVDATAFMTLANVSRAPQLIMKARRGYGKALSSLRAALNSPTEALKDETFASVVILSVFEDVTGDRNGLYSSHTAGFEFLMKLRGKNQLDYRHGRDMFNFAYTHTFVEILALGDRPRVDVDWIIEKLDANDPIERLLLVASKMSQLFLAMQAAPSPPDIATVKRWIVMGQECDFELSQWTLHLPESWLPLVIYSSQGEALLTYQQAFSCVIWNYYRAARVMLQQLLLSLNRTYSTVIKGKSPDDSLNTKPVLDESCLRAIIQEMTNDVCKSMPFVMSDVDSLGRPTKRGELQRNIRAAQANGLLWPLWYIVSCGMPSPEQVDQIRIVLHRIGTEQGINLALMLARETERMRNDTDSFRAPLPQIGSTRA